MTIKTAVLPSGRTVTYDDSRIPKKPGAGDYAAALGGQIAGPLAALPAIYGLKKMGILGGTPAAEGVKILSTNATPAELVKEGLIGSSGGADAVGSALTQSGAPVVMSDGSVLAGTSGIGPVASGEAYGSMLGGSSPSWFGSGGSIFDTQGLFSAEGLPLGNVAGGLLGAYGVYDAMNQDKRSRSIPQGILSGAGAGYALGGPIGAPIGAVVGGALGATAHESTKDRTNRRFGDLAGEVSDPNYLKMIEEGKRASLSGQDTWDIGQDVAAAPLDILSSSYGVLKTFGPSWSTLSPDQRKNVTKALAENNLLNSKQGDYVIDDPARAEQIKQEVLSGRYKSPVVTPRISGAI